jgi:hypothetical protein
LLAINPKPLNAELFHIQLIGVDSATKAVQCDYFFLVAFFAAAFFFAAIEILTPFPHHVL